MLLLPQLLTCGAKELDSISLTRSPVELDESLCLEEPEELLTTGVEEVRKDLKLFSHFFLCVTYDFKPAVGVIPRSHTLSYTAAIQTVLGHMLYDAYLCNNPC